MCHHPPVTHAHCCLVTAVPVPGAVSAGARGVRVPLLETWCTALHVLPHTPPTQAVDQEEQSHFPQGMTI